VKNASLRFGHEETPAVRSHRSVGELYFASIVGVVPLLRPCWIRIDCCEVGWLDASHVHRSRSMTGSQSNGNPVGNLTASKEYSNLFNHRTIWSQTTSSSVQSISENARKGIKFESAHSPLVSCFLFLQPGDSYGSICDGPLVTSQRNILSPSKLQTNHQGQSLGSSI